MILAKPLYLSLYLRRLILALLCLCSSTSVWAITAEQGNLLPSDLRQGEVPATANVTDAKDPLPVTPQVPSTLHEFVNSTLNIIEFKQSQVLFDLFQKWESKENPRISIAHFGDSHIQGGYAVESARQRLQQSLGSGGRGMVFPYAIAKTYSQNDFKSSFQGEWSTANSIQLTPRLPLGISGFVARTHQFKTEFELNFTNPFDPGVKKVRLLFRASHPNYEVKVSSGSVTKTKALHEALLVGNGLLEFDFPELKENIHFEIANVSNDLGMFDLTGVSIENYDDGLLYHNLGVGGSAFGSLLAQSYFDQEISFISPDVVILDWGTNDIIYKNTVPDNMREVVKKTIDRVRAAQPKAVIILTSVQDMNFRRRNIDAAQKFSQLMRELSAENDCLFYDWFRVSGGADSMTWWHAYGLASQDQIHLSSLGYRIKGELMAQALLNSLQALKIQNMSNSSMWINETANDHPQSVVRWLKTTQPYTLRAEPVIAKSNISNRNRKKSILPTPQKSRNKTPIKQLTQKSTGSNHKFIKKNDRKISP